MNAECAANRCLLLALADALPVHEKIVLEQRLLALLSGAAEIPGVVPKTQFATEVRREIDGILAVVQRSALHSLAS